MIRKAALLLLAAVLLFPACKEEKKDKPVLSPEDKELLRTKGDEKVGIIIQENLPALFAGVVAFDKDVFAYQSYMLEQAEITVLNSFGKGAILLLNSPNIPPLLREKSVRKIRYLCLQKSLVRLGTTFEMEVMRRAGAGTEDKPIAFFIRFKEAPDEKKGQLDTKLVEGAGYKIMEKTGLVWTVEGPISKIYRLLEYDGIVSYELASGKPGTTIKEKVPFSREPMDSGKENASKQTLPGEQKAVPFQPKPPPRSVPDPAMQEEK